MIFNNKKLYFVLKLKYPRASTQYVKNLGPVQNTDVGVPLIYDYIIVQRYHFLSSEEFSDST